VLICGHVHRPGETAIFVGGRSRRVLVVPDWFSAAGWIEWERGVFRIETGRGRPDAGPAVLAELPTGGAG
jgi:hypothetical protein